ncbi:hypothetical protein F6X40_17140 [Paraburkholderia sp. UCT31]|uniref:hypothetical protein n=1 Tax=Paraburkholderia sp. UCT31 TaxID=2615209 RepID=UPI001655E57E|nr:hypothetical protein [Paraburkholderia sp. UCT31]MBC8738501.1 hypothetical protein [Paraburkholderia sp. UCT31]
MYMPASSFSYGQLAGVFQAAGKKLGVYLQPNSAYGRLVSSEGLAVEIISTERNIVLRAKDQHLAMTNHKDSIGVPNDCIPRFCKARHAPLERVIFCADPPYELPQTPATQSICGASDEGETWAND